MPELSVCMKLLFLRPMIGGMRREA